MKIFQHDLGEIHYKKNKKTHIIAGDPLIYKKTKSLEENSENQIQIFNDFKNKMSTQKSNFCGYYFSKNFRNQMLNKTDQMFFFEFGVSQYTHLENFHLSGYDKRDLRRALNFGTKQLDFSEIAMNKKSKHLTEILDLEKKWLRTKKLFHLIPQKIEFLLSSPQVDFENANKERWFVVKRQKKIVSFVSLIQNNENSYYLDNMIYDPHENKKSLDYLLTQTFIILKNENQKKISLGLIPFHDIRPQTLLEKIFYLHNKLNISYNSKGLFHFKKKYSDSQKKRYLMLPNNNSKWPVFYKMLKETYKFF